VSIIALMWGFSTPNFTTSIGASTGLQHHPNPYLHHHWLPCAQSLHLSHVQPKQPPPQPADRVCGFIETLKPSPPLRDGVNFHRALLMGSTTNLVVEDADTYLVGSVASPESDAKIAKHCV